MNKFSMLELVLMVVVLVLIAFDLKTPPTSVDTVSHQFSMLSQTPTSGPLEDYLKAARYVYLESDEINRASIRMIVLRRIAGWDLNEINDPLLTAWVIDLRKSSSQ